MPNWIRAHFRKSTMAACTIAATRRMNEMFGGNMWHNRLESVSIITSRYAGMLCPLAVAAAAILMLGSFVCRVHAASAYVPSNSEPVDLEEIVVTVNSEHR